MYLVLSFGPRHRYILHVSTGLKKRKTDPAESHTSIGIPESLLNSTSVPSSSIAISNFGSSPDCTIIYAELYCIVFAARTEP